MLSPSILGLSDNQDCPVRFYLSVPVRTQPPETDEILTLSAVARRCYRAHEPSGTPQHKTLGFCEDLHKSIFRSQGQSSIKTSNAAQANTNKA